MKYATLFKRLTLADLRFGCRYVHSRKCWSEELRRQNEIFDAEVKRQREDVGRIEKIEVTYNGRPEPTKLLMNKSLSTPYNVAQHVAEWLVDQSALALVNKETPWDMHRPLQQNCQLDLLTFTDADPFLVNKAFWRTCSFVLGAAITDAFNEDIHVDLHSFPSPQVSSGSFIYDTALSLNDWRPSLDELRSLSATMVRLSQRRLPIQRIAVDKDLALHIFEHNRFKLKQIPDIANNPDGNLVLYRVGGHIDISKGPMVGNTSFIGRCSITAVHQIESEEDGILYRFQGVALPKGILLNHFAYHILEERASKLNTKRASA